MAFNELRAISALSWSMPRHRDASPEEVADWCQKRDAMRRRIQAQQSTRQRGEGVA